MKVLFFNPLFCVGAQIDSCSSQAGVRVSWRNKSRGAGEYSLGNMVGRVPII